jgi:hypothetical protein
VLWPLVPRRVRGTLTSLDDLAQRVDAVRTQLFSTLTALKPNAPIAEWLAKLQEAGHELLTQTYRAMSGADDVSSEPSDIAPAVDQLREAFLLVAAHVSEIYQLPAARNLADTIGKDLASQSGARTDLR